MSKTYEETLDYLYHRLPVFQHIGKAAYKADLKNTIALCAALGNPEKEFKSVHVAGTNGKGSVSSTLAAIFTANGYKTGLYTSPHLKDFRERIRIDGHMIPKSYVVSFTEKIQSQIELLNPSFFEITVAMAFCWFAEEGIDMSIIETGMGGRLDSTNVITPELSLVTNVGMDHMEFLGDTRAAIAAEKAGIIKKGVPIVLGEPEAEILTVFEQRAVALDAPLLVAESAPESWLQHFALKGDYQRKNLAAVFTAVKQLQTQGYTLEAQKILTALEEVQQLSGLRGRWEVLGKQPTIIADCAHNEHGLVPVMEQLLTLPKNDLHMVIGMVSDKDHGRMLALLPKKATYYFCKPNVLRGMDAAKLQELATHFGLRGEAWESVPQAIEAAKNAAGTQDVIYIGGSTFVVAEAL